MKFPTEVNVYTDVPMKLQHLFLKTIIAGSGALAVVIAVLLLRTHENEKRQQALEAASQESASNESLVSSQADISANRERVREQAMESTKAEESSQTVTTKTTTPVVTKSSPSTTTTKPATKTTKTS